MRELLFPDNHEEIGVTLSPLPATPITAAAVDECVDILTSFEELEARDVAKHDKEKAEAAILEEEEQQQQVHEELVDDETIKGLPLISNVVPRIMYSKDVEWHLQERDNTNMNSLKLGENGVDTSGIPIQSVSRFLTNSNDRIGRILTNPNMTLKKVINRKTALVLFNKMAEQFNMRKIEMLKRDCQSNVLHLIKKLWLNEEGMLSESSVLPASFYNYVHAWDTIDIYNSENKVEKFNATATYFNCHMADILYCIENKMNALTYITQMCTGAVFYASNSNHTKFIQALNEMNNGLMNGADYYRGMQQWDPHYYQQQQRQWRQLQQQQETTYEYPVISESVAATTTEVSTITPQDVAKHQ